MRLGVEAALVRGELVARDVEVEGGLIIAVGLAGGLRGRMASPGFQMIFCAGRDDVVARG